MLNEALRLLRVFHDLTLTEMAKELEISAPYLSEIENGKKAPTLELVRRYARIFKTSPSSLLFFSEEIERGRKSGDLRAFLRRKTIQFLQKIENAST